MTSKPNTTANVAERWRPFFPGLLGMKLVVAEPDRVVAEIAVREDLCTVPG